MFSLLHNLCVYVRLLFKMVRAFSGAHRSSFKVDFFGNTFLVISLANFEFHSVVHYVNFHCR